MIRESANGSCRSAWQLNLWHNFVQGSPFLLEAEAAGKTLMRIRIQRIGYTSAFRVGAVLSALSYLVFFLPLFGINYLFLLGIGATSSSTGLSGSDFGILAGAGLIGLVVTLGFTLLFAAIGGGIGMILFAFAYNLTVGWVGGLELDLERMATVEVVSSRKAKTSDDEFSFRENL